MQLSPTQVVLVSASLFVGVVASSFVFKYLSDQKFREDFATSNQGKFLNSIKPQLIAEEHADFAYQPLESSEEGEDA